ncbi:unnamed protein product [Owenia fusiformis]|uniref:Uncharacterized protein n=1 Tax=Owenia fusiformis TaxID=6347 RepID=A0A8J1TBS1_OWEFU|nr:unnamed protein product [Owenia fusiformis]
MFRAKKSPKKQKAAKKEPAKHEKLADDWGANNDKVKEGVVFYVKYLGSTLVEELGAGQSYGDAISAKAVKTIVEMAKAAGVNVSKLPRMVLKVFPEGIQVSDLDTKEVKFETSIYRISFCTADSNQEKICAYIARNSDNETMECKAFLCAKRKIAEAITLTVAQTFNIAYEHETRIKEEQSLQNTIKVSEAQDNSIDSNQKDKNFNPASEMKSCHLEMSDPWTDVLKHSNSTSDPSAITNNLKGNPSSSPTLGSVGSRSPSSSTSSKDYTADVKWEDFDLDLDDHFSQLAVTRSTNPSQPEQSSTFQADPFVTSTQADPFSTSKSDPFIVHKSKDPWAILEPQKFNPATDGQNKPVELPSGNMLGLQ